MLKKLGWVENGKINKLEIIADVIIAIIVITTTTIVILYLSGVLS